MGRVTQGGRPPRVPTDPDLPNSGIRLVMSRRYGAAYRVDRDRWRKRVTLQEAIEAIPSHPATAPSARQPRFQIHVAAARKRVSADELPVIP